MSALQKREILRYSGVSELPRPREGTTALDAALVDLMDDAVRSEYLHLTAQRNPSSIRSPTAGQQSVDKDGTSRQSLLQGMAEALEAGDMESAEALRDRFTLLTMLKADHTQSQGSYQQYLDQDEWYMVARRKAMGIPSPSTLPSSSPEKLKKTN